MAALGTTHKAEAAQGAIITAGPVRASTRECIAKVLEPNGDVSTVRQVLLFSEDGRRLRRGEHLLLRMQLREGRNRTVATFLGCRVGVYPMVRLAFRSERTGRPVLMCECARTLRGAELVVSAPAELLVDIEEARRALARWRRGKRMSTKAAATVR